MKIPRLSGAIFLLASFGGFGSHAKADEFHFSYGWGAVLAPNEYITIFTSGTLTTTNTEQNGALFITGISGSRTTNFFQGVYFPTPETDSIVSLYPPGQSPTSFSNDNLLYPDISTVGAYLTTNGFAYQLSCTSYCGDDGAGGVQIGGYSGEYFEIGPTSWNNLIDSYFTLTAVPEPQHFALLGLLLFGAVAICKAGLGQQAGLGRVRRSLRRRQVVSITELSPDREIPKFDLQKCPPRREY